MRLKEAAGRVLGRHPWVAAAWFHGSAARGQPARDIDIALVGSPPSWSAEARITRELVDESGLSEIEFDVRAVDESASPVFLGNLLRDGELIYEANRERRIEFQAHAMSMWLDFRPVWERLRKEAFERWSR